ncbi:TM0106 family RecB-like putative nuclease [Ornithinimicrobium sp. F0845]|uniref:TM0106 family RecB-like putative nuclease n=1 Tax=Ornithinimicrobium sp. F0845 TaxID=2926412 RepID=UPI001FF24BE2|nr:TM0106 family RecB-like putative nuclease [Ornithinimicrobium sp. F0845]MCK0112609.1 TM0106 family RecB-like putative nuclease [Ornithinimicrobium sp. F0845]
MHLIDGTPRLSATDLTTHLACAHATTLDLEAARGRRERPEAGFDEQVQLVFDKGLAHERSYLAALQEQGRQVVHVPGRGSVAEREAATVEAMYAGAQVIYQAAFADEKWVGYADFLLRVERPSRLGSWSYDVADTKLARHLQTAALLQMASYAQHLERIQGVAPQQLVVVTGDGAEHPWRLVDVESYARRTRERLEDFVAAGTPTRSAKVSHCARCRWLSVCEQEWVERDDLVQVAGLRSDQREQLEAAGITTVAQLASATDADLAGALTSRTRDRARSQARLQVSERETGVASYELLPARPGEGLELLPAPDPGDVYLDFEGDPFAEDGAGREYLAGIWTRDEEFLTWWAHDRAEEKQLTRDLLTWLDERWQQFPGMHIYHYAAYEQTALKRMAQQHATAETELDMLLRGERFVDLYAVVRQSLQISKPSYSIKKLEAFYWEHARTGEGDEVADALTSVIEYERWLAQGRDDQSILDRLAAYNREDVRSTHALHEWLEARRAEAEHVLGRTLGRPGEGAREEATDSEAMQVETALAERLVDAGQELLAGCIGFHRREQKQVWWDYYRTAEMSGEDLAEDRGATLGGLGDPVEVGSIAKSLLWRYEFPPQETSLSLANTVDDAREHTRVGTITELDAEAGYVVIKRVKSSGSVTPTGLVGRDVMPIAVLQESLQRLADDTLAGRDTMGLALLEGRVPSGMEPRAGESPGEVVRRVGAGLDRQVLAVQGPPGSGKSYSGTQLIRDLLDAGLRVGITANSHSVLTQLVEGVGRPAVRKGVARADQSGPVRVLADNEGIERAVAEGATLVAGTAWLWARAGMADAVDVLVVDEAGQFALANALAVAQAATRGIVLLGDPQQLPQVVQGSHPYGAERSVLEHLINGAETIAADRGVFLDLTYRMHPAITRFVSDLSYASRLESAPGRERQEVAAPGELTGSGLRWVPVEHEGNVSESMEEAEAVVGLVADLLRGTWTDDKGTTASIGLADILVVSPYNAQVRLLQEHLPEGLQVGTVDKFQGRQAPVVIFSMASSSGQDAPRGVGFLLDSHRVNVAVSRAKALAVVVGSPALLESPVSTPEQLRLVNALCRFVDLAEAAAEGDPSADDDADRGVA